MTQSAAPSPTVTFDAARPCASFEPPPRRRGRRRATEILFVEQQGARFVVKSFAQPDDRPGDAAQRAQRELDGIEGFRRAGVAALAPLAGPTEELALQLDGSLRRLPQAMVFPYVALPTLYDVVAESADPAPLVREAGRRIRARHAAAKSAAAIHSDGSAHNVFSDWTWFDFCEPHAIGEVRHLEALEVLRFVSSVVEVSRARRSRPRVAAFCEGYGDRSVLLLALDHARQDEPHVRVRSWSRMLGRPDKLLRFLRGDTRIFRRIRTWDALDHALRD